MTRRHAEIAGAGFAGLTLGAALAQRDWTVRIHERSPECRTFGAGIWFWENGFRVLNAIGACDDALDGAVMAPSWESFDEGGKTIDRFEFGNHETGGRIFCIVRQQLYEAVHQAALRSGVEIETFEVEGMNLPAELVLDLPSTTELSVSRNKVHINKAVEVAIAEFAKKLTQRDIIHQDALYSCSK